MTTLFAPTALLPEGWAENVLIEIDRDGWIAGVDAFKPAPGEGAEILSGPVIPGMTNAHSHAFQRAMAGMAERAGGKKRSFWNWRDTMYRFLASIGSDDLSHLCAEAYAEMLESGFTGVAEFHYLHHGPDGAAYDPATTLARAAVHGALEAGIAVTLLPALYAQGSFGGQPSAEAQRRFLNTVPSLMRILEGLHAEFRTAPQVSLGLAHHSLRAVGPDMLLEGTRAARALLPGCPVHILVAGMGSEVEQCVSWSGLRPVEWLLERGEADRDWCFVHATHINEVERREMAARDIVAALTPSTEANMGGGIFPLHEYFEEGGAFAVGTGSHITIGLAEELRWLEYGQRLRLHERTVIARSDVPSAGATLYEACLSGGARAAGRRTGKIAPGHRADLVVLDDAAPAMQGRLRDHLLDSAIFASTAFPVRHVMSGGRWAVRDGKHRRREQIRESFLKTMRRLGH